MRRGLVVLTAVAFSAALSCQTVLAQGSTQTTAPGGASSTITVVEHTPPGFSSEVMAQGRRVYLDLQDALTATYGHDAITLKLALTDAQRRLSQLYGGPGFEALQAQMEIIRHNLAAEHPGLDQGLWIPLRAEVERFLWRAPEQVRAAARSAVEKGRAAASMHERKAAREQIEVLLDALQYRVQVFPLRKVREDVDSAIMSGFLPTPDWEATRQALDSALGQVRWFTRERAYGLLDAYLQVANAYTAWPDTQKVTDYLKQAADDLAGAPEEQTLVTALRDAAQNPTQKAVADLLSALHGQIQTDQQPGLQGSVGRRSPHGPPLARARTEKALWLGFATGLETAV